MSLVSEVPKSNTSCTSANISNCNVYSYDTAEVPDPDEAQKNEDYDSGILSNSNFSSLCEVETRRNQTVQRQQFVRDCKCSRNNFVIPELKKKIVQLNLELSRSNQENCTLKTDLKFQNNQIDYFKKYAEWYKTKCSKFKSDNMKLRNEDLETEIDITKCKHLIRILENDKEKWLKKFELIKLESCNKYKLATGKLETLECKVKSAELRSKHAAESLIALRNTYEFENKDSKMKIEQLKFQISHFEAHIETLKNDVSEFKLKNSNLENILGRKNDEIHNSIQDHKDILQEVNVCSAADVPLNFDRDIVLIQDLKITNEELNKIIQLKDIEMKDKIKRYEAFTRTLLQKIKEYKTAQLVYLKKSNHMQEELNNLTLEYEKSISQTINLNRKLLTSSAVIDNFKKYSFKLKRELLECKTGFKLFNEKIVALDKRKCGLQLIDCKNIDSLIEKSCNLDQNIYQNNFDGEFSLLKSQVQTLKNELSNNR